MRMLIAHQPLGAVCRAVTDTSATKYTKGAFQLLQPLSDGRIPRIHQKTIGLKQASGINLAGEPVDFGKLGEVKSRKT